LIPNDTKRQKAYDRLRKLTSDRIGRALSFSDKDLAKLSLAQLFNLIFLIHGDTPSTGNFNVSFVTALELVGPELVWYEPEMEKVSVVQFVQ
jgi:hypothetical protein